MARKNRLILGLQVVAILMLLAVTVTLVYFYFKGPDYAEKLLVRIEQINAQPVSAEVAALHQDLFVLDLHADPLLWSRDISVQADRGHVDVPRLLAGNVGLQVFSVVSKVSPIHNHFYNADLDAFPLLAYAQRWPLQTWFSLSERGFYQAEKLLNAAEASAGQFEIITDKKQLRQLITKKNQGTPVVGGLLAFEGVQTLEGSMDLYQQFYEVGYRMMGLAHFFDTEAAGSRHGAEKYGLTAFGKTLIKAMERDGVVLDLAHASDKATDEALRFASKPLVVSHTGVKGVCDRHRNLSDEHIKGVAKLKGVVGIGYWPTAACGLAPETIVKSIRYVADLVGVDYVGLGSDFDGAVTTGFDTSELVLLTQALKDDGFSDDEIHKIMGANALRVLLDVLPDGP
ncbi:MAG: membrane dipeptidase [Pseudomonadales bacterium]|nr:membrane dipeptidase [Pseudomonadales bacterium]